MMIAFLMEEVGFLLESGVVHSSVGVQLLFLFMLGLGYVSGFVVLLNVGVRFSVGFWLVDGISG
jgi:hypothetical protein